MWNEFQKICELKDYKEAVEFQNRIAALVPGSSYRAKITSVCGIDISFEAESNRIYAAAAVYSFPGLALLVESLIEDAVDFPYIPGLLAFREGPVILKLIEKLPERPEMLMFDGHGIAHPRRAGIAALIGLLLHTPSIGCAKTRLIGNYKDPGRERGSISDLIHDGSVIGRVVRTRSGIKPIFVSSGFMIDLSRAVEIALNCCRTYRIPEPLREAHRLSNVPKQKNRAGPRPAP